MVPAGQVGRGDRRHNAHGGGGPAHLAPGLEQPGLGLQQGGGGVDLVALGPEPARSHRPGADARACGATRVPRPGGTAPGPGPRCARPPRSARRARRSGHRGTGGAPRPGRWPGRRWPGARPPSGPPRRRRRPGSRRPGRRRARAAGRCDRPARPPMIAARLRCTSRLVLATGSVNSPRLWCSLARPGLQGRSLAQPEHLHIGRLAPMGGGELVHQRRPCAPR